MSFDGIDIRLSNGCLFFGLLVLIVGGAWAGGVIGGIEAVIVGVVILLLTC